jgi:hypothetical protein
MAWDITRRAFGYSGRMSEASVLVNFRLDRDQPMRVKWRANDGHPGDGYKPQITAIRLSDGDVLHMDASAIMEQCAQDTSTDDPNDYIIMFNGMVGFAADHADRARIDRIVEDSIDYDLEFIAEDGRHAMAGVDFTILDKPRGLARNLSKR